MGEWTDNNITVVRDLLPEDRLALARLRDLLASYGSAAVAYSGGVDSTLLLAIAAEQLGKKALAITALSPVYIKDDLEFAQRFARERRIRHELIAGVPPTARCFQENPVDRCYYCKKEVLTRARETAEKAGAAVLVEATNLDDYYDFRPGLAASEELGVRKPLVEVRLTKHQIRLLSRELGLPGWDRQSQACLATRFPFGTAVTNERLEQVEAAEEVLKRLGFRIYRVRWHGELARVEVGQTEMEKILNQSIRESIYENLHKLGFRFVSLDLKGYRAGGKWNDPLPDTGEENRAERDAPPRRNRE